MVCYLFLKKLPVAQSLGCLQLASRDDCRLTLSLTCILGKLVETIIKNTISRHTGSYNIPEKRRENLCKRDVNTSHLCLFNTVKDLMR